MSGKCPECEEGLPEWVMSYADMITILMAFFVVMYSMAGNKDTAKEEAVLKSLRERFGPNWMTMASFSTGSLVPHPSLIKSAAGEGGSSTKQKKQGGAAARAPLGDHPRVHTLRPGEQAGVGGVIFFPEGSAQLGPEQEQQLDVAASEVGGKPQRIEIRGHASRRPLPRAAPYRDNWDLAYARCRAAMERLTGLGIDPKRIRLSVAGDNERIDNADRNINRYNNSRVEVFMLNEVIDNEATRTAPGEKVGQDGDR